MWGIQTELIHADSNWLCVAVNSKPKYIRLFENMWLQFCRSPFYTHLFYLPCGLGVCIYPRQVVRNIQPLATQQSQLERRQTSKEAVYTKKLDDSHRARLPVNWQSVLCAVIRIDHLNVTSRNTFCIGKISSFISRSVVSLTKHSEARFGSQHWHHCIA